MEERYYNDIMDDCTVKFYSDAEQKLITSLEFNGDWWTTKRILLDWGYTVIELNDN